VDRRSQMKPQTETVAQGAAQRSVATSNWEDEGGATCPGRKDVSADAADGSVARKRDVAERAAAQTRTDAGRWEDEGGAVTRR